MTPVITLITRLLNHSLTTYPPTIVLIILECFMLWYCSSFHSANRIIDKIRFMVVSLNHRLMHLFYPSMCDEANNDQSREHGIEYDHEIN